MSKSNIYFCFYFCLPRDKKTSNTCHTNASGGGSFRGAAVRVLLRVHRWPPGGSASLALSLIQSVRDWSWTLHRENMSQEKAQTFKVSH